ncbi:alpha/beta-hydrolase [Aaosphaeria arxii CBS 175.79]|uniref:Alpha/beta-hydrolase n=1 Tax=Aaosphaeria arxii CBS 175.79 TaxID=1450172 RepID=A0A6A5Y549_9PLEO|nr:alpha/beta-hydrolase [Aaosphaeria arxii CBS 175.79]KAF2020167.1 alpha/beta-hydrolase [Aaosphaeria arxii CBS 175.79]
MHDIKPYTISIPDSQIDNLRQKLALTTFPDELDDAGWDYGAPLQDVKRIATHWKDAYDWRKAEASLNKLPNFMTIIDVDGFGPIDIHFVHQKSEVKNAIPLLFVHGWPGSFIEVTKILPILTGGEKNGGPAFHVVAPSLPNFGFSGGIKKKGFDQPQYAEVCHKLMLALGYGEYVTQGGDWGFGITRTMGQLFHHQVKASHINTVVSGPPISLWNPFAFCKFLFLYALKWYTPAELEGLKRTQDYRDRGQGYYHQQTTRPQTLGYSLADSPVGLLGWVYEKLGIWSDGYEWSDDEVCTWLSIYWFSTAGPAASVRIYYEAARDSNNVFEKAMKYNGKVPLGLSYFPKEVCLLPRAWGPTLGPIIFRNEHDHGGHFAAYEVPDRLAGDLGIMFGRGGPAFGCVPGKDGYA